ASAYLEVDPAAPAACWDPADTPDGRDDWVPLSACGVDAAGEQVAATLHVCSGYLEELELWADYGQFRVPRPETLQVSERLPIKTRYALARAVADRLRRHVSDDAVLT